jgi:hypothetical protein
MNTFHLTDTQLDDALLGDLSPAAAKHLATCAGCTERVAEVQAALGSFRAVSLAWGERRSATLPLQAAPTRPSVWTQRLSWTAAMSLALALAVAVPSGLQQGRQHATQEAFAGSFTATQGAASASDSVDSDENQISQDNLMLKAIDQEIAASSDSPSALGLQTADEPRGKRAGVVSLQD